jgi:hypothetical protein
MGLHPLLASRWEATPGPQPALAGRLIAPARRSERSRTEVSGWPACVATWTIG